LADALKIDAQWLSRSPDATDSIAATFCNLRIRVNDENITYYETEGGVGEDHLEIPSYYFAEWLAENWWPLLWEPCKSEDASDDPDFRSRHLISTAEHGFVLPNLNIVPAGERLHLFATARDAKYSDARFKRTADTVVERVHVEAAFRDFVEKTVARLAPQLATPLQAAWFEVAATGADTEQFCRLMGALGLSPYEKHETIERALDSASRSLDEKQLLDLCLTATPEDLVRSAYVAVKMQQALKKASEIDLAALPAAPADQTTLPAYKFGYRAARLLRDHFSIAEKDVEGGSSVFEKLNIDYSAKQEIELSGIESPVVGGLEKRLRRGRLAVGADSKQARRFAAARATFFFLTGADEDRRLITNAVTRDQQASRAFAAELLVPQSYVRSRADGSRLKWDTVNEIAEAANVSAEVIKRQASNIGLQLVQ
jgi:hypothetical protein